MLHGASTEETLRLVAERARDLAGADWVLILLTDPGDGALVVKAAAGERASELLGERLADGPELFVGLIADLARVLRDDDLGSGPPFGPALAVRLRGAEVAGGLLAVRAKGGARFTADQEPMLSSFANQAAMALEVAETQRNRRLLDVLADRDRIAGDLHDHVIQRLFATGMSLQGTVRRIADPDVARRVSRAVEQLDATVREIRTSIFELPTTGEDGSGSLRRRLLDTVAEISSGSGVNPAIRISGAVDTLVSEDAIGDQFIVVVRDSVSNSLQHAKASEITITVEARDYLILEVVDNGINFPPDIARAAELNARRRAEAVRGTSSLWPLTNGNCLAWRAPIR
jgi:signal transduction histidine kinase